MVNLAFSPHCELTNLMVSVLRQFSFYLMDNFSLLIQVLISLPGVTAEDVQRFEEKLQGTGQNPAMKSSKIEKVKKDVFKKLIIEVNISAAVSLGNYGNVLSYPYFMFWVGMVWKFGIQEMGSPLENRGLIGIRDLSNNGS